MRGVVGFVAAIGLLVFGTRAMQAIGAGDNPRAIALALVAMLFLGVMRALIPIVVVHTDLDDDEYDDDGEPNAVPYADISPGQGQRVRQAATRPVPARPGEMCAHGVSLTRGCRECSEAHASFRRIRSQE